MRTSESITSLATAIVLAQVEVKAAEKDGKNPAFKSRYTTLAACIEAARPALAKHGLCVLQSSSTGDHVATVTTRLLHKSGEWIEDDLSIPVAKWDAQGIGSALTYGRRYGYCAMVGVVADEDDDGNSASRPAAARPQPHEVPWSAARNPMGTPAIVNPTTGEEAPALLQGSELPPEATLTVPEQHKLWKTAKDSGWTAGEFEQFLRADYNVGASRDIPRSKLDEIIAILHVGRAAAGV